MHPFSPPGYWAQHVGKVMRVIGGDPSWVRIAASTSQVGGGSGGSRTGSVVPLRPGNAGGGKGPDFWCAFEDGEDRVIGDEP